MPTIFNSPATNLFFGLAQTGTAVPTLTILENGTGIDPVITRTGVGTYRITAPGQFTDGLTMFPQMVSKDLYVSLTKAAVSDYVFRLVRISADVVELQIFTGLLVAAELSTVDTDPFYFEIRVFKAIEP